MSSWTIYWLLKLDSFLGLFAIIIVISLVVAGASFLRCMLHGEENGKLREKGKIDEEKEKELDEAAWKRFVRIAWGCVIVAALAGLAIVFTPSTKQAVAIYAVPKIFKEGDIEAVREELGDGFALLKDCLRELIEDKPKGKSPE